MGLLNDFRRRILAGMLVMATFVAAGPAVAMRVSPMVVEMDSRGSGAVARVEVQNINQGNLAFETRVFLMTIAEDGSIIETPADEEFLIFPPQGVLPPGGRQVVRLQWVGDPTIPASKAFYVSIQQLPVEFRAGSVEAADAQVQVLYNMRALVVVAPPGAKPDVKPGAVQQVYYQPPPHPGSDEALPMQDGVQITLTNEGLRHAMMSNFGWRLEGMDAQGERLRVDITPEELNRAVGTGYVPARGTRTFIVPVSGFGQTPIRLTFTQ